MSLKTINPATGEMLQAFDELTDEQIEERLARAQAAFAVNRRRPFAERARRMREAAAILEREKQAFGRLMTTEMGKPIGAAVAEAEKCALGCRFYADHAERFLADEHVELDGRRSFVRYQPIGIVLAIMPWNFPFWQVFRFAAPALMAGNVGLLKHASNVPQCALAIEEVFRRAGFDSGELQSLLIGADRVERIIADARVRAVTLTGSDRAGTAVASSAGQHLKKTVLELGGSDPFIILEDADLAAAARTAAAARLVNSGQSCIAAKRFIVVERVAEDFLQRFVTEMSSRRVGDPLVRETDVGPQAREDLRAGLHRQVEESVRRGAEVVLGGRVPEGPGAFSGTSARTVGA